MNIWMLVPGGVGRLGTCAEIPALLAFIARISLRNRVRVIALTQEREPCEYDLAGARIYNLGQCRARWGLSVIPRLRQLRAILSRQKDSCDLVHSIWFGQSSTLALAVARWLSVPVVASLGGGELVSLKDIHYGGQLHFGSRLHSRFALRAAHRITAGSHYALSPILAYRPDALWIPLFPAITPAPRIAAVRTDEAPRLLTVSSVNRVKDPETLLRAFRLLLDRVPTASLDWVGEDILGGDAQRLATALGVADHVRFCGYVTQADLVSYYARAHIYVQASRHESQGVAVCEAAAAGLSIVGTNVGILSELAPSAAVAVPVANPAALAEAVVRVLESPELAADLASNSQRWACQHTADWTAARFEEVYEELVSYQRDLR